MISRKTNKLPKEAILIDQTVFSIIHNIMIKIYETPRKGYSFRLVSYQNNTEIDPLSTSNNYDWAYGPFKSPAEAKKIAKSLYKEQK